MIFKTLILTTTVLLGALPAVAMAEPMDRTEVDLFRTAILSFQQAGDTALKAHGGDLSALAFNDEDGRGVFEATVIGAKGDPWTVKIDAKTGDVLASGQTAMMLGDHPDHKGMDAEGDGDGDGETDDD